MRVLVAGWFSFEDCHATAGDLLARDLACEWLRGAGHPCDVAAAPPFVGDVDWRRADPARYAAVVFVCGPFARGSLEQEFLSRFAGRRLIGLNLSMLVPLDRWNPFDRLWERDSSAAARPDITFLSRRVPAPVVGVCLVEDYPEGLTGLANDAVRRLVGSREMAAVPIDTRLDGNATGLRSPAEVEALLARMDVVITTRLHGLVLALKNGVPVIAIDPMGDGCKVLRQAETVGWPVAFGAQAAGDEALQRALDFCLSEEARRKARECGERARRRAEETREAFIRYLAREEGGSSA